MQQAYRPLFRQENAMILKEQASIQLTLYDDPAMQTTNHAITTIITSNYINQALTLHSYIKENEPTASHLILIISESDCMPKDLPEGPEWICWDVIYDKETRLRLASEFIPFELTCVTRGRFHHYLATQRNFDKWIMLDTDIGVLTKLDPVWEALDSGFIVLTPHSTKPVSTQQAIPHEANLLKYGLFNGGVVGMKRSETAKQASKWLSERLELYGHSYAHRKGNGLPGCHDFEFADQIWLNLMYLYFGAESTVLGKETWNLGHWNLHQGDLELRGGEAYFNGERVLIAHFSGLPLKENLDKVSSHSQLYTENRSQAWAIMAAEYLDRLESTKARSSSIPYSYSSIQPGHTGEDKKAAPPVSTSHLKGSSKRVLRKVTSGLRSPGKIISVIKLLTWKLKRSLQIAQSIVIDRGEDQIFRDRSENGFTNIVPCIGNYETYLVRSLILQAVVEAKDQFHGKLLDVGAGSSPYEELIMANGKVKEYIKLDFASSDYHQGNALDLTWDGKTIPLETQSIDTVFMTEVLEHVHKPGEMLQEVRRVLKPGGILFLTVPFSWPMHELPYDYHRFTPIALRSYLEEASFDVQGIRLLGGWDFSLAQQIGLWLTNRSMGDRKRKMVKLLARPFYSYLLRSGKNEFTEIRNHQIYIGLAGVAFATNKTIS
jgi:SAM-dependent methyltransferase